MKRASHTSGWHFVLALDQQLLTLPLPLLPYVCYDVAALAAAYSAAAAAAATPACYSTA
jgi:hypothetical protein